MKITHAQMEVVTVDGDRVPGHDKVTFKAKKNREIDLRTFDLNHRGGLTAEIRVHLKDADLAESLGNESDDPYVLMDWFQIHDATVTFFDGRLKVIGYQMGVEGSRRDGKSPVGTGKGNPLDDYDRPLVRVRWDLW